MSDHAPAVRRRPRPQGSGGITARQGLAVLVLILLAFGTAVYLGMRHPYQSGDVPAAEPLRTALVPLAPPVEVPGAAAPDELFERSPAEAFRIGADGVTLPSARRTENFTETQVLAALTAAKEYIVQSSLDPAVLSGRAAAERSVRLLLDPGQHRQFDRSVDHPSADGRHAATGWMVRFHPSVTLADPQVRVSGTLTADETGPDGLEVIADHVFVYAVRPAGSGTGEGAGPAETQEASLFTVRREVRMHLDREDLRDQQIELRSAAVQAGPMRCDSDPADALRPLLAGQQAPADSRTATDPYAGGRATASVCGVFPAEALPTPAAQPGKAR